MYPRSSAFIRGQFLVEAFQPLTVANSRGLHEVIVAGAFDHPHRFRRLGCRIQRLAEPRRDDFIMIALHEEFWNENPADLRSRIVAVNQQRAENGDYGSSHIAGGSKRGFE